MARGTPSFGWAVTSITLPICRLFLGSVACRLHGCLWQKFDPLPNSCVSFTRACTFSTLLQLLAQLICFSKHTAACDTWLRLSASHGSLPSAIIADHITDNATWLQLEEEIQADLKWCMTVEKVLHSGKSDFQSVELIESGPFGKVSDMQGACAAFRIVDGGLFCTFTLQGCCSAHNALYTWCVSG